MFLSAVGVRPESGRRGNPIGNKPEPERMQYAWLGALVGQDGILRPIGNRPTAASIRPAGGLATRRRMPSCPTFGGRFYFHVAHLIRSRAC